MTNGHVNTGLQSRLDVLATSVDRLAALVHSLSPQQLRQPAYPSEWTVADVLSHLGSGAVITRRRLDGEVDIQSVWDEWNAKDPDAQAAGALEADAALQARLASITPDEAATLHFAIGPREIDLATFIGFRVNEHVVHSWDISVAFDDSATIPSDAAELIVDTLPTMAGFAGKPTGTERTLSLHTVAPARDFELSLRRDGVALTPHDAVEEPDLELSGDALIRLVYGRLDPSHSPRIPRFASELEELRSAFPGI